MAFYVTGGAEQDNADDARATELLKRYEEALLAIIHMDVYTRDTEAPAHEVMREIAIKAVKPSGAF